MRTAFFLASILLLGCPPPEVPKTDPDGLATPLGKACANLRTLHCPEGEPDHGETCFEHLTERNELVEIPVVCLASAKSIEEVRACGNSSTLRVRCRP